LLPPRFLPPTPLTVQEIDAVMDPGAIPSSAGSITLFVAGVVLYLFAIASLSIFLATLTRSMPQFALLAFPMFIIMNLLSGGNTPLDSMPPLLQTVMQGSPSTHFVSFAQAILYRGAGFDIVWRVFAATAAIGAVF